MGTSTIDSSPIAAAIASSPDVRSPRENSPENPSENACENPSVIVLQPIGLLDQTSSLCFQEALQTALSCGVDAVIVDLLWVEQTDRHGISALVAGIQQAAALGKLLSFQAMNYCTRSALEMEWIRQREISIGCRCELFEQDLERFLDSRRGATVLQFSR